jgi:hypothetical protein
VSTQCERSQVASAPRAGTWAGFISGRGSISGVWLVIGRGPKVSIWVHKAKRRHSVSVVFCIYGVVRHAMLQVLTNSETQWPCLPAELAKSTESRLLKETPPQKRRNKMSRRIYRWICLTTKETGRTAGINPRPDPPSFGKSLV